MMTLPPSIKDPRSRYSVAPVRIVTAVGDTDGASHLCMPKTPQTGIYPHTDGCFLRNSSDAPHAAVLVDFGRELHGCVGITTYTASSKSMEIRIRLGESVGEAMTPLGQQGACNDHAPRDMVLPFTFYGSAETPESGFRFAWIELITPDSSIELRSVTATLVIRDLEYIGSFASSDPLLTEIYDTAAWTVHLNMQRYLWDGIKRDRLVWAGDMNTEIQTVAAVFGDQCDVVRRSLDYVRDVTPADAGMNNTHCYSMWWLIGHYDWYMATGDHPYLVEQMPYMKEMVPHWFAFVGEDGAEKIPGWRFLDWPTDGDAVALHVGLQGLLKMALTCAQTLFLYCGESALAVECQRHAARMEGHIPAPTARKQASAILALSGIGNMDKTTAEILLPGGAKGLSTFLSYYTLEAISAAGRVPEALDMIREYFGGMLSMGATSFWEDFDVDWMVGAHRLDEMPVAGMKDIHGDFGRHCYTNFRHSLCHGWASGAAPILARRVLGVMPLEPGFRRVAVRPAAAGLRWMRGTVPTPRGEITVEVDGGHVDVRAPEGVEIVRE